MNAEEYELVRQVQTRHWWWLGREKLIEKVIGVHIDVSLKLNIADVGCGFGANISMLRKYGDVTGLELNSEALDSVKLKWGDSVRTLSWMSPVSLPVKFNFMLLGDVLEHIPDDKGVVEWIFNHLTDGGCVLITVPAHQFLWTQMDDVLAHHRRYSLESLTGLFDQRFEILYVTYYNAFLFPIKLCFVAFDRIKRYFFPLAEKRSYNDIPPSFINSTFKHVLMLESYILGRRRLPFGVSLICLVKKRGT